VQDRRLDIRYNMSSVKTNLATASQDSGELCEICDRLREMGYAQSKRIRIYGQEFEVVSNPFPQGTGVAVHAVSKKEPQARILPLPLPILQMVTRKKPARPNPES
jgi:hypothetical protein